MLTPIGEMRDPAHILTPTTTVDAAGGETTAYATGAVVFIAVRATTAREASSFGQINAEVTHIAHGHWQDFNAVTSKQRIRLMEGGVEFDIVGPPINSPMRDWTRLNLLRRENV